MDDTDKLATGKDIILEIVRAMRGNVEPLLYSTVAPTRFFVYLHPADHHRLEGIFPLLVDQARRALDDEVRKWNEGAKPARPVKWPLRLDRVAASIRAGVGGEERPLPIEPLPEPWEIRFEPDADGEMQPGDIAVASELTFPKQPEFDGTKTRRITTMRHGEATSTREQVVSTGPVAAAGTAGTIFATLAYEDRRGPQKVSITANQLVVGRGGVGYWVDVKLDTSADVSREHLRLRRDEATGQFFLKDLSSLGTTIDGVPVPSSIEVVEGRKRDKGVEVPLPQRARIGLATVIVLEFEALAPHA
jgi:pSer/pThr/pTyr-binding forkhead associated (FHA) protein